MIAYFHRKLSILVITFLCLVLAIILSPNYVYFNPQYSTHSIISDEEGKNIYKQELKASGSVDTETVRLVPSDLNEVDNATGNLQIPYSGLSTVGISPPLATKLGLDPATRGDAITHVISGSPAHDLGIRSLNLSKSGSLEEIVASRGDIIFAVDGSTSFTTEYDDIEQYIFDNKAVGENITLSILRDGKPLQIEMRLEAKPLFLWYENREEGIMLKYPSDWTVVSASTLGDGPVVQFRSSEKDISLRFPVVIASVFIYSSYHFENARSFGGEGKQDIENFRLLDIFKTTLGKLPAYSSVYYDYSQSNSTQKVFAVFAEHDPNLYSIIINVDPDKYTNYLSQITEMIQSFRFIK